MKNLKSFLSVLSVCIFLSGGSASAQMQKKQTYKPTTMKSYQQELKQENPQTRQFRSEKPGLFRWSEKIANHPFPYEGKASGKAEGKATITLKVEIDWSDGSGYQILLDADHNTYGTVIPVEGYFSETDQGDYSEFEYTLPEGASGDANTDGVVTYGETLSIDIEPGIYDLCVTNPTPGDRIWIASGKDARMNDMEFIAGVEYVFVVSGLGNGDNCKMEIICDYNIAVAEITAPFNKTAMKDEAVTAKLSNKGKKSVSSVKLSYTIDGGSPVEETFSIDLDPGRDTNCTFAQKTDLSKTGRHEIIVRASVENDLDKSNDTLRKIFYHTTPVNAPFSCTFDNAESFGEQWVVIDADGNGSSWSWTDESSSDTLAGSGCAVIATDGLSDDYPEYLLTLNPISLKAGKNHLSYYQKGYISNEHLTILYGKTSKVEEMEVLADRPHLTDEEWTRDLVNFTLEEDGDYYFAFAAQKGIDPWFIYIDQVEIGEGSLYGVPDLNIDRMLLPVSSCILGSEPIGMRVSNFGYGDVTNYTISYSINGGPKVEETVTDKIAIKETKDIYFQNPVDFSTPDGRYAIKMEIKVNPQGEEKEEENMENNADSSVVIHYTPAELPFTTDFNVEDERTDWATEANSDWYYDDYSGYYWNLAPTPLYSRCVELEAGKDYRFAMNYGAGDIIWIFQVFEEFAIAYGKTGTDIATWDTILYLKDQYTEGNIVEEYASFKPKEAGSYTFAVLPVSCNQTLHLQDITISEILDYDIRMTKFSALPRMIPAEHANNTFQVPVEVKNMGAKDIEKAKVSVSLKESVIGSKEFEVGKPDAVAKAQIEIEVAGLKANDEATFVAKAEIVGQTDMNPDNELSLTSHITEDVLAYDQVTAEMCGDPNFSIGSDGYISCGVLMNFSVKDTLTEVAVMWSESENDLETDISIYKYDNEAGELQDLVYTSSFRKGTASGEKRYKLPSLLLESGYYLISVGVNGYVLTTDMDPNGVLYVVSNGAAKAQEGLGTPGIRAIFGHDGTPYAKDAYIAEISKPENEGLFAENEPIVVKVGSNGYEETDIPVHVTVNGKALESQTVKVPAYGKTDVTFTADLSAPGTEFEIVAFTTLDGDQDRFNDTLAKTVKSLEPADPYEMNFEYCPDFAIEGFNPAWKSVDQDAAPTYGFQGISFPHSGEAFGFMAFNPALTEPAMTPEESPDIQAYSGERLGVAFASSSGVNNDWLISPKLTLPKTDAKMSLFVKTYIPDYGLEAYKVLISSTENLNDFTELHSAEAPSENWEEINIDLSPYAGKDVYLAIQCVSPDRFIFMVDNIKISKPAMSNESDLPIQLSLYPNPAYEMISINSTDAEIRQVSIFNTGGMEIYTSSTLGTDNFRYNVSALSQGIYFARVKTNQGTAVMKFIVK